MSPEAGIEREARRQRALLRALRGEPHAVADAGSTEAWPARGLEAYRANAEASAERALSATFPTIRALVGDEAFARLAREHWRAQPPERGDLGEWGDGFAQWLERHPAMSPWPYLADCARLDRALHRCERAMDASLDAASLLRLESDDPATLRLDLMPGSALIRSTWPIASIHAAHRLSGDAAERAFDDVRAAIALPRGEDVFIVREGWRAVAHHVDDASARWTQALLDGHALARALDEADPAFDFAVWLQSALRHSWLKGVSSRVD